MIKLSALALCLSGLAAGSSITLPVSPRGTFFYQDAIDVCGNAQAAPGCTPASFLPTIINLSTLGISAGQELTITGSGELCYFLGPACALSPAYLAGIFSATDILLDPSHTDRVPGAVFSGLPPITGRTSYATGHTMDTPDDFFISDSGTPVTIPTGAEWLFVGQIDSAYRDNSGQLDVRLDWTNAVPESGSGAQLLAGLVLLAAMGLTKARS